MVPDQNIALGIFAFGGNALRGVARAHGEALGLDAGIGLKHGQHVFNHGSGQRAVQNQLCRFPRGAVSAVAQATLRAMMAQRNKANSFFMDDSFLHLLFCETADSICVHHSCVFGRNSTGYSICISQKSELPGKKTWGRPCCKKKAPERPAKQGLRRQSKGNAPLSGGGPLRFQDLFALSPPPLPGFPR